MPKNSPLRLAINGYGRIGRCFLRALLENPAAHRLQVVAINEPANLESIAYLSRFDSTHGRFPGRVEVGVSEDSVNVRVDVRDNGVGISREHQGVIFEKFRQVGDTLTDKPAGTGLGLAICRQIIGHFGGTLSVESEPGSGSLFTFTLPRHAARAAAD